MANFPNAVTAYATRNPGDAIPSADWDSFGAEITAIEDGYINGTARLNSSNSTVANLSVTGGSTFGGAIVFSTLVTAPQQPRCQAHSSNTQTLTSASTTVLTLDVEDYDVGGLHSTAINPSRMTVPVGSSGLWRITGQTVAVLSSGAVGDQARLYIRKNGADLVADQILFTSTANGMVLKSEWSGPLDGGDFVELAAATFTSPVIVGSASVTALATRLTATKIW